MQYDTVRRLLLAAMLTGGLACANGSITMEGTGGSSAEGGNTGSGGDSATGGNTNTGGSTGTGGIPGTGGIVSTGGNSGGSAGRGSGGRIAEPVGQLARPACRGPAVRAAVRAAAPPAERGPAPGGPAECTSERRRRERPRRVTSPSTPAKTYQVVDGFGEADVWQGSSSTAMQTLLWDPVNGIGLNLLRVGIDGTSGSPNIMGAAGYADGHGLRQVQRQRVQGVGGALVAARGRQGQQQRQQRRASELRAITPRGPRCSRGFLRSTRRHGGVDLYAISAQNEPDFTASYQSCLFNASQMVAWIDVLGPALAALSPPVKVLAAEPDNWGNIWGGDGYGPAIIADSMANSFVGPIATHDYGSTSAGTYARPAPPANNTHHVWETECTPGDTGPITIATMIYAAFSTGGVSGWHYWWTEALVPNASSPPPQVYALGNFSKFVRPGYYRVDVSGAPKASGTTPLVVAFTNLSDGTVSIVVVNGGGAANVSFFVAGTAWPASVTPYVTTSSSKLAAGTAISVSGGRFSASLAGQSVTTFVGKP